MMPQRAVVLNRVRPEVSGIQTPSLRYYETMQAFTAGCRWYQIPNPQPPDPAPMEANAPIPTLIFYPSQTPEQPEALGPYEVPAAMNADVAGGKFPLLVISHGTGGSPLVYRGLGRHLARSGYVVAMPQHPGNNRDNNELAGTATLLVNRPKQIRLILDWAYSNEAFDLTPDAALIGHSLGGYTALAVAGGEPTAFPHETPDHHARKIEMVPDPRVKALILLAPATAWFMAPGALSAVSVPILMLTAEKDHHTPPWHAEIVKQGIADKALLEHRIVANAGHFSFLTPFPPAMIRPDFPPSQDPPGFEREHFEDDLSGRIVAFLKRVGIPPPDGL